jgi:phospholipid/cholesterol/gamma-HCH transport system substrate-binding protein
MENKSHALAAGTFVLALLAVLIALAVWLTRDNRALRTFELSSSQAVSGLQPEATVRFRGVDVGKVTAIGFDPLKTGQVLIRIAVDDQAPVTESTFATLGFQGVTGLAFIALDDTGASSTRLPDGRTPPTRIPLRPGLLSKLSDQGLGLLSQLEESSQRFNALLNAQNQKALLGTVSSLGLAASRLQQLANEADQALGPLVKEASATLQTLKETSDRVGDSADEARASAKAFRVLTERMNEPGGTLDQLTQGTDTLAATGQTLNAATLPRLNKALDDTARTVRRVGQASELLRDNPQSLIFGHGTQPPGPGEAGFSVKAGKPP